MELKILGSSSKGNGYVLTDGKAALIIECGVPYRDMMKSIGFNRRSVVGCLVSHKHKDHSGFINQYLDHDVMCFVSEEMSEYLPKEGHAICTHEWCAEKNDLVKIGGGFWYRPIRMEHDAVCWGFIIFHKEMGFCLFVTDTAFIPQDLSSIKFNHVMIECNYSDQVIEHRCEIGLISRQQMEHVMKGHLSYANCLDELHRLDLSECTDVTLLHLSDDNSLEDDFVKGVWENVPGVEVRSASGMAGQTVLFNKESF